MTAFRILLALMIVSVLVYTGVVGFHHGWNLFPVFFGDLVAMNWPGQFNFDFSCFLLLSSLWTAWRNEFSPSAFVLAALAFVGGISFLAPYLLYLSFRSRGDIGAMLLGTGRSRSVLR